MKNFDFHQKVLKCSNQFCYHNCSYLLWEKIVLVTEQNFWDHWNNLFKQWKFRTIFGNIKLYLCNFFCTVSWPFLFWGPWPWGWNTSSDFKFIFCKVGPPWFFALHLQTIWWRKLTNFERTKLKSLAVYKAD